MNEQYEHHEQPADINNGPAYVFKGKGNSPMEHRLLFIIGFMAGAPGGIRIHVTLFPHLMIPILTTRNNSSQYFSGLISNHVGEGGILSEVHG